MGSADYRATAQLSGGLRSGKRRAHGRLLVWKHAADFVIND